MKRSKTSAGLLMFRKQGDELEVLLVHPGGPYFQNKDDGAWTIPKGEVTEGDELLRRDLSEHRSALNHAEIADEHARDVARFRRRRDGDLGPHARGTAHADGDHRTLLAARRR